MHRKPHFQGNLSQRRDLTGAVGQPPFGQLGQAYRDRFADMDKAAPEWSERGGQFVRREFTAATVEHGHRQAAAEESHRTRLVGGDVRIAVAENQAPRSGEGGDGERVCGGPRGHQMNLDILLEQVAKLGLDRLGQLVTAVGGRLIGGHRGDRRHDLVGHPGPVIAGKNHPDVVLCRLSRRKKKSQHRDGGQPWIGKSAAIGRQAPVTGPAIARGPTAHGGRLPAGPKSGKLIVIGQGYCPISDCVDDLGRAAQYDL